VTPLPTLFEETTMSDEKSPKGGTDKPDQEKQQTSRIKEEHLGDARSDMGADDTTPENYGAEKAPNPGHPV